MTFQLTKQIISDFCSYMKINMDDVMIKSIKATYNYEFYAGSSIDIILEFGSSLYRIEYNYPSGVTLVGVTLVGVYYKYYIFNKSTNQFMEILSSLN